MLHRVRRPGAKVFVVPEKGFGPFRDINIAIVGTDNYDFILECVANLVVGPDANIRAVRALSNGRPRPALILARDRSLQEVV